MPFSKLTRRWAGGWEGTQPLQLTPTYQRHSFCSISYSTILSNKSSGKGEEMQNTFVVFPSNCMLWPCFPESSQTSVSQWKVVNEFLFPQLVHRLLLSLLNCHYLKPWVFLPSFHFLPVSQERRVSQMLSGCFITDLVMARDISCSWSVKIFVWSWQRMSDSMPSAMLSPFLRTWEGAHSFTPKCHLWLQNLQTTSTFSKKTMYKSRGVTPYSSF